MIYFVSQSDADYAKAVIDYISGMSDQYLENVYRMHNKFLMLKITRTIIVEGNYDKIKLASVADAHIIATDGFRIFRDKAMQSMIMRLAKKTE